MKKLVNNITIRIIFKEEDNKEKLIETLKKLVPFDLKEEKIEIKSSSDKCLNLSPVGTLTIELTKNRHIRKFLNHLFSELTFEQIELLTRDVEERLDERCCFSLRLDKEKLIEGKYLITKTGNCFYIGMSIAAYPAKKENGALILKEILDHYLAQSP